MRFYYASGGKDHKHPQASRALEENALFWLNSFATKEGMKLKDIVKAIRLMLDSGAFSAWTQNEQIDLNEYITYIKEHQHQLECYVNLDVIPGRPGVERSQHEIELAAQEGFDNYKKMRKAGLDPIPVYHQGESKKWLERYRKEGCTYIGISPSADASANTIVPWLDEIFTDLTTRDGVPLIKTHGFGVASFAMMKRYPWFTCDSTFWVITPSFGNIFVPQYKNGEPDYSELPITVPISNRVPKGGFVADHYTRLGPMQRERVRNFVEHHCGMSISEIADETDNEKDEATQHAYAKRTQVVVRFIQRFTYAISKTDRRFRYRRNSLLSTQYIDVEPAPGIDRTAIHFFRYADRDWKTDVLASMGEVDQVKAFYGRKGVSGEKTLGHHTSRKHHTADNETTIAPIARAERRKAKP
jgi:hypothetical protein